MCHLAGGGHAVLLKQALCKGAWRAAEGCAGGMLQQLRGSRTSSKVMIAQGNGFVGGGLSSI